MKKTEQIVVWASVTMSKVWFIGFFVLFLTAMTGDKKDYFKWKLALCAFIACVVLKYINSREDGVYKNLWPSNTEKEEDLSMVRDQSMWLALFIGALLLFLIK